MDKITYLAQLAEGLARWVPERERQDILRYYAEYFEEAGPDREAEVVHELGDPWALSSRLAVEGGYVTQEQAISWTPKKKQVWPWVLAGAAVVLMFAIGSVISALVGFTRNIWQSSAANWTEDKVVQVEEGTETAVFAEGEEISGGFWSAEDGYLEAFDEIDLDVGLANVTVTSGEDCTLFIQQDVNLGGYSLKWEVKNGVLKIRDSGEMDHVNISSWNDLKEMFGADQRAVEIDITVPDGRMLNRVKVTTGLGNVLLSGLIAEKVEAETGMGNVECYGLCEAKKLNLESGMGNVTLVLDEPCGGADIDLESGMGNVEATLGCAEWECEYELDTGLGTVTVNGSNRGGKAARKGNASYKLDAESGMGDVVVSFSGD